MFQLQLFSIWIAASACSRHTGEMLALKGPGTGLEPDWNRTGRWALLLESDGRLETVSTATDV